MLSLPPCEHCCDRQLSYPADYMALGSVLFRLAIDNRRLSNLDQGNRLPLLKVFRDFPQSPEEMLGFDLKLGATTSCHVPAKFLLIIIVSFLD